MSNLPYISRVCLAEEERFIYTLNSGLRYFEQYAEETLASGGRVIPGDRVFKLYDTFGFPLDLCQELAREKNLEVDEAGFQKEPKFKKTGPGNPGRAKPGSGKNPSTRITSI